MSPDIHPSPSALFFEQLARWFGALAEPNRLHLIWCLKQRAQSVNELAAATRLAQPLVSKHLATLREVGLVSAARQGRQSIYAIADPALVEICQSVCGSIAGRTERAAQAAAQHARLFTPAGPDQISTLQRKAGK